MVVVVVRMGWRLRQGWGGWCIKFEQVSNKLEVSRVCGSKVRRVRAALMAVLMGETGRLVSYGIFEAHSL